jgi:hypothetical protein
VGLHILLEKVAETKDTVTYRYDFYATNVEGLKYGVVEFNHLLETYKIIKERDGDEEHVIFSKAMYAILREWKRGSFPDRTDWAS